MGVEPFLLSSSLLGVLAQRLVRVLNPEVKEAFTAGDYERKLMNVPPDAPSPVLYRPRAGHSAGIQGSYGYL
jgi:general secretion pathway protein E